MTHEITLQPLPLLGLLGFRPRALCSCGWRSPTTSGPRAWQLAWEWGEVHKLEAELVGTVVRALVGAESNGGPMVRSVLSTAECPCGWNASGWRESVIAELAEAHVRSNSCGQARRDGGPQP